MTTREKFEAMIFEHGVFESQAKAMMDFAIPKIDAQMVEQQTQILTWYRPSIEYPNAIYATVFMIYVRPLIVEWIDANLPLAWYRPMFANENLEMQAA